MKYKIGDWVFHKQYGFGTICRICGNPYLPSFLGWLESDRYGVKFAEDRLIVKGRELKRMEKQ